MSVNVNMIVVVIIVVSCHTIMARTLSYRCSCVKVVPAMVWWLRGV